MERRPRSFQVMKAVPTTRKIGKRDKSAVRIVGREIGRKLDTGVGLIVSSCQKFASLDRLLDD